MPSTASVLSLDLIPLTSQTRDFETPRNRATSSQTAWFACPSTGVAVTKTLTGSPGSTRLCELRGVTRTTSSAGRGFWLMACDHGHGRTEPVEVLAQKGPEAELERPLLL